MENVILVIHLLLALAIIGLVLLQRSEGGGLGIGGNSGGMGNVASAKSMSNVLTKATTLCAIGFFCTSLLLGILAGNHSQERNQILNSLEQSEEGEGVVDLDLEMDSGASEPPAVPIAE